MFGILLFALSLTWTGVTLGTDGSPLDPSEVVTQYNVYRCNGGGTCTRATSTLIGVTIAPAVTIDITSQPTPSSYVVTAVNIVNESLESPSIKVTPPMAPGGPKLK